MTMGLLRPLHVRNSRKSRQGRLTHKFVLIYAVLFVALIVSFGFHFRLFQRPTVTLVAQSGPGRLGNQIFQYASSLGISHATGVEFCVDPDHPFPFDGIFQGPFPNCTREITHISVLPEIGYGIFTKFRLPSCWRSSCFVAVGTYLQSYKYLDAEITRSFVFVPAIQQQATTTINQIRSSPDKLIVGIHVRRGDIADADGVGYLRAAPVSYFVHAMDYYERKYAGRDITFLVASDDIPWCVQQEQFQNATMVHSSAAVDLAILSLCDHMILSVGTFGWFAGKFARGDVVYYRDAIVLEHPTNKGFFHSEDYYPPEWTPMI